MIERGTYLVVNQLHFLMREVPLPGVAELIVLVRLLLTETCTLLAGHVRRVDVQQVLPECATQRRFDATAIDRQPQLTQAANATVWMQILHILLLGERFGLVALRGVHLTENVAQDQIVAICRADSLYSALRVLLVDRVPFDQFLFGQAELRAAHRTGGHVRMVAA